MRKSTPGWPGEQHLRFQGFDGRSVRGKTFLNKHLVMDVSQLPRLLGRLLTNDHMSYIGAAVHNSVLLRFLIHFEEMFFYQLVLVYYYNTNIFLKLKAINVEKLKSILSF